MAQGITDKIKTAVIFEPVTLTQIITAVVSRHIKYGRKHSTQYTQGISSGILCLKRLFLERYCAVGFPTAHRILHAVPKTVKIVYKPLSRLRQYYQLLVLSITYYKNFSATWLLFSYQKSLAICGSSMHK